MEHLRTQVPQCVPRLQGYVLCLAIECRLLYCARLCGRLRVLPLHLLRRAYQTIQLRLLQRQVVVRLRDVAVVVSHRRRTVSVWLAHVSLERVLLQRRLDLQLRQLLTVLRVLCVNVRELSLVCLRVHGLRYQFVAPVRVARQRLAAQLRLRLLQLLDLGRQLQVQLLHLLSQLSLVRLQIIHLLLRRFRVEAQLLLHADMLPDFRLQLLNHALVLRGLLRRGQPVFQLQLGFYEIDGDLFEIIEDDQEVRLGQRVLALVDGYDLAQVVLRGLQSEGKIPCRGVCRFRRTSRRQTGRGCSYASRSSWACSA